MRTQITDLLNTDSARECYHEDLSALSDAVSRTPPTTDDPIRAAYDFARLCELPEQLQVQLDTMYANASTKIDALKIPKCSFFQLFCKKKLSQRDAYRARFLQDFRDVIHSEKDLIDETLDQFDHLDDQVAQLESAIANLNKQCGGEE